MCGAMLRHVLSIGSFVLVLAACGGPSLEEEATTQGEAEVHGASTSFELRVASAYYPAEWLEADLLGDLQAATYRIGVKRAGGDRVQRFSELHSRPMHLIAVSDDFSDFEHVHPELDGDGYFWIDKIFYSPAKYRFFYEYQPSGTSPQLSARRVSPPGAFATRPSLNPDFMESDAAFRRAPYADFEVLIGRDRDFVAGQPVHFTMNAMTGAYGAPKHDLTTYLGMAGHAIFVSSDGLVFGHEHGRALDAAPGHSGHASAGERMLGTNLIDFELTFPRAGDYRVWFEVKDIDRVHRFDVDVRVAR
jgi:hypothetical protein